MKVTKAQAQANRERIVETASTLFRECGYDGVGVADLMGAAGFTHGGFYKHFGSKVDLMAESAACGLAQTVARTEGVDATEFIRYYLSRQHRDNPGDGCTMAALSGDAARQPKQVQAVFATGLEDLLAALARDDGQLNARAKREARAKRLDTIAHLVGAVMLSRACPDDSSLADEVLAACRSAILSQTPASTKK